MKKFAPGWKMTSFVVVLLPLLISFGIWQLARGAEKRSMETDYLVQLTALPLAPTAQALQARFQRVRLRGQFGLETFLVDNQISNGRTGYWLVQTFDDASGQRFLTNRGFVAAPKLRSELPVLHQVMPQPEGPVSIIGTVWPYTGLIPLLDDDPWDLQWPTRVQRLDVARMAKVTGAVPVEIRLEPGQPGVEVAAPFAQVLSDAKHRGYAATWFGLAVALVVGYGVFGTRHARQLHRI